MYECKRWVLSRFSRVQLFATLWTVACQAVHGILQARILGWIPMPSSKRSSKPRDQTRISSPALVGRFFTTWEWRWELDHKEGRAPKNWCFWIVVLKETLESPLNCKGIKLGNTKGIQPWIFTGRSDAEAPILWPPDAKIQHTGKDPGAENDWRWEKRVTEDEMVGWHHWLDGHEFEQTEGGSEGQGSLACCRLWGPRVRQRLRNTTC